MANKNRIRELLGRLNGLQGLPTQEVGDFADHIVGEKTKGLAEQLRSDATLQMLDGVTKKLDQFKSDFNLEPVDEAVAEIKAELETVKQTVSEELEARAQEFEAKINGISSAVEQLQADTTNEQSINAVSDAATALEDRLNALISDRDSNRRQIETAVGAVSGDFDAKLAAIKSGIKNYDPTQDKAELNATIVTLASGLRTEFVDKLSKLGGGQADRNIKFSGSVLTRYTDLNILGASFVNNDTTKQADVTLPSSGGGSTNPGGLNAQVQYNNNGSFGGVSGATTNGSILSLTNALLGGAVLTTSSVNGVYLQSGGSTTSFLNANGGYSSVASGSGTPGGLNTQLQFNNSGAFAGISGATTNGSIVTLITPNLGTPSVLVATFATGTASQLTVGSVITNANLTGVVTSGGNATSFGTFTSSTLSAALSDETGSGKAVFANLPTLTTPIVNNMYFTPSGTASEQFYFYGKGGATIPVPFFYPNTANTSLAFDISPNGTPGNTFGIGPTWIDLLSTDVNNANYEVLRISKRDAGACYITSAQGGTAVYRDLMLQYDFSQSTISGNTGIGTPTASTLLQVGDTSVGGVLNFQQNGGSSGELQLSYLTETVPRLAFGRDMLGSGNDGFILKPSSTGTIANTGSGFGSSAAGVLDLYTSNGTALTKRITINGSGLVTVNGSLTLSTAGNKLSIATGTNASVGTATLVGGTVTVSTTAVTASSKIFLTDATTGALTNVGSQSVGTIVAGTSFVINSTNPLDTSNVNWFIIN